MASLFVDTNVFLRFLTNDDPAKAKRAETLFRDALRGKIRLATSLLGIAEIIWTLEAFTNWRSRISLRKSRRS
ncbi:MAG: PIN domain-containing protein [Nitrospirota bacterium]